MENREQKVRDYCLGLMNIVVQEVTRCGFYVFDLSGFKLTKRDDSFIVVVQASGDARALRH